MRGVGGQAGRRPHGTTEAGGTATARDQGSARDDVGNAGCKISMILLIESASETYYPSIKATNVD